MSESDRSDRRPDLLQLVPHSMKQRMAAQKAVNSVAQRDPDKLYSGIDVLLPGSLLNVPRKSLASKESQILPPRVEQIIIPVHTQVFEDQIPLITHHQRGESGSTGYSFPEPANSDSAGLPRPRQRKPSHHETQEDQPQTKPKKRVQFRNVATEPELQESSEAGSDSNGVSREDTMVEHSVVVNEEEAPIAVSDYMHALESAKFDQVVLGKGENDEANQNQQYNAAGSGEGQVRGVLQNNFTGFTSEDDHMIEKTLLQMRNRIRSGLPLSHQVALHETVQERPQEVENYSDDSEGLKTRENFNSPDERSENILSSGINNFRLSRQPIGAVEANAEVTESSSIGLVPSSKLSHNNNNLSKRAIQELHPKKAASLMVADSSSRKVSPAGILKQPKRFIQEQAVDSVHSELEEVRRGFRQPQVSAAKRRDNRIHQSATHSPVSNCITRDAANVFEKKKQRMAKIQQLRGTSNQSASVAQQQNAQKVDIEAEEIIHQPKVNLMEPVQQSKKQSTSQPQTPRDSFMLNLFKKLNRQQPEKPQKIASAQPKGAKALDSNAKRGSAEQPDSNISKKKAAMGASQRRSNTSAFDSEQMKRNSSSGAYQPASKQAQNDSLERNLLHFMLNPASSLTSLDHQLQEAPAMPKIKSKNVACAKLSKIQYPKSVNRLLFGGSQIPQMGLAEIAQNQIHGKNGSQFAKNARKSQTNSLEGPIAFQLPQQVHSNQQHQKQSSQKAKQKQHYNTERHSREQRPRAETKSGSKGLSQIYADQNMLAKLKALNYHRDKHDSHSKDSTQKNTSATARTGAKLSYNDAHIYTKKQRYTSSPARKQQGKEKSAKQQTNSKSMANANISKLLTNIFYQSNQQQSLLQKDQIIFLLKQLAMRDQAAAQQQQAISSQQNHSENYSSRSIPQRMQPNNATLRLKQTEKYQKCESGSTGYSFPEPANSDSAGLPRPRQRKPSHHETQEDQPQTKPKKRVQFRNVATEPELQESSEAGSDSNGVSREDTMVEHSVVVNEEEAPIAVSDYMHALESAKFDGAVMSNDAPNQSGEFDLEQQHADMNGFPQFNSAEDLFIEQMLLRIRDRVRSGLPLSHQIAQDRKDNSEQEDFSDFEEKSNGGMIVTENQYSPDERSENILSSGINNFRLSRQPIGAAEANAKVTESSPIGLVLSSKPSHKNNNLSKRAIQELHPKKATSLLAVDPSSRKVSPVGILKQPKKFIREQTVDSGQSELEEVRRGFRQPQVSAAKRRDNRIHQSATYSPVSHCITRDAANVFEKKKQRLAKIQQLRGISNQSENDQYFMSSSAGDLNSNLFTLEKTKQAEDRTATGTSQEQIKKPVSRAKERLDTSSGSKIPSSSGGLSLRFEKAKKPSVAKNKKHPASQPLTPRKFTIENILQKLTTGQAKLAPPANSTQLDEILERKPQPELIAPTQLTMAVASKKGSKAPPVTGINTNTMNSQQKKKSKSVFHHPATSTIEKRRLIGDGSTCTSRAPEMITNQLASEVAESQLQLNLVNFLLNPTCSATSLEESASLKQKVGNSEQKWSTSGQKRLQAKNNNRLLSNANKEQLLLNQYGEINLCKIKQHKQSEPTAQALIRRESAASKAHSVEKQVLQADNNSSMQLDLTKKNSGAKFLQNVVSIAKDSGAKRPSGTKKQTTLYSNSSAQELFKAVFGNFDGFNNIKQDVGLLDHPNSTQKAVKDWLQQNSNLHHKRQVVQGQAIAGKKQAKRASRKQNQTCDSSLNDLNALLVSNFMGTKARNHVQQPVHQQQPSKTPKGQQLIHQFGATNSSNSRNIKQPLFCQNAQPQQQQQVYSRHIATADEKSVKMAAAIMSNASNQKGHHHQQSKSGVRPNKASARQSLTQGGAFMSARPAFQRA